MEEMRESGNIVNPAVMKSVSENYRRLANIYKNEESRILLYVFPELKKKFGDNFSEAETELNSYRNILNDAYTQYLKNNEEYREIMDSILDAISHINRSYPAYDYTHDPTLTLISSQHKYYGSKHNDKTITPEKFRALIDIYFESLEKLKSIGLNVNITDRNIIRDTVSIIIYYLHKYDPLYDTLKKNLADMLFCIYCEYYESKGKENIIRLWKEHDELLNRMIADHDSKNNYNKEEAEIHRICEIID